MKITDVMTTQEAGGLYGRTAHTIKQACESGRLTPDECRKSGKMWLVTKAGMERLYGPADGRKTAEKRQKKQGKISKKGWFKYDTTFPLTRIGSSLVYFL